MSHHVEIKLFNWFMFHFHKNSSIRILVLRNRSPEDVSWPQDPGNPNISHRRPFPTLSTIPMLQHVTFLHFLSNNKPVAVVTAIILDDKLIEFKVSISINLQENVFVYCFNRGIPITELCDSQHKTTQFAIGCHLLCANVYSMKWKLLN